MNSLITIGKPIEKLISTVASAIGILYEPTRIRRKADADAYRLEKLDEARAKGLISKADAHATVAERAQNRLMIQQINKQINIEEIVERAVFHLREEVSVESVDHDWRTRFFSKAEDVFNSELQEIWAKILAEEISMPGSTTLRTLDLLANLNKQEAEAFSKLCKLTNGDGSVFLFAQELQLEMFDINFYEILLLSNAGLIYSNDEILAKLNYGESIKGYLFDLQHTFYFCKTDKPINMVIEGPHLTPSGIELMKLLRFEKDNKYEQLLLEGFKKRGFLFTSIAQADFERMRSDLENEISKK